MKGSVFTILFIIYLFFSSFAVFADNDAYVLTKETFFDSNDEIIETKIYEYNEDWNIITVFQIDIRGIMFIDREYVYNKNGNIEKKYFYDDNNNLFGYLLYRYDLSGKVISNENYTVDNKVTWSVYTEYQNSLQIRQNHYDKDNKLTEYYEIIYDKSGNIVNTVKYNNKDEVLVTQIKEYDKNGNMIKVVVYNENGETRYMEIYEYGNKIKTIKYNDIYNDICTISIKKICEFDDNGNMIKSTFYNADEEAVCAWIYKFDENMNKINESYFSYIEKKIMKYSLNEYTQKEITAESR